MGCWDETCGLTNTIVRTGDPCVMVVMKPKNQVGYVSHVFGFQHWDFRQVKEIHKGTYDDYGWLEEVEDVDDPNEFFICFFHKRVWDEVVAFEKDLNEIADEGLLNAWHPDIGEYIKMKVMAAELANEAAEKCPEEAERLKKSCEEVNEKYKVPEFGDEFIYIARFGNKVRRDIISGPRWRGHQDDWDQTRRHLIHRLSMEHVAEWRFRHDDDVDDVDDVDGIDQYGRYCLDEEDDPTSKVEPENPTLSERIADVLRTDDKWDWKEAIAIHGYTPFELLREAQQVLRAIEISKNDKTEETNS